MSPNASRSEASIATAPHDGLRPASLRDLFVLLGDLLVDGGDPRIALDRRFGVNRYGCGPLPAPELMCLASSTASPISERAYARTEHAREQLMHAAIGLGVPEALDRRTEEMRSELRTELLLAEDVEIVFAPSGTDAQLTALALSKMLLGAPITSIVVGADQSGSGAMATARGHHFSTRTASGIAVQQDTAIAGLGADVIAMPLFDRSGLKPRTDVARRTIAAIARETARGQAVMLQVMDSSKLGWRAPADMCLDTIAQRWPDQVQVVVDACQMRLSRGRLRSYLDRGWLVLISGSKFFGGPAFSGALLVPGGKARAIARSGALPSGLNDSGLGDSGLGDYVGRSDWPMGWTSLRAASPERINLGAWLRWEAALAEIRAYHAVPEGYRRMALRELGATIEGLLALSPVIRPAAVLAETGDDGELGYPTIFPFALHRAGRLLEAAEVQRVYRALQRDLGDSFSGAAAEVASRQCLVGQPVPITPADSGASALLRLCIGARQVSETWSADLTTARVNLEAETDRIADVFAKLQLLVCDVGSDDLKDMCDGV